MHYLLQFHGHLSGSSRTPEKSSMDLVTAGGKTLHQHAMHTE